MDALWFVYIALCNDDSLYTGITKNIKRREFEHNTSNRLGSKSLRSKRPIKIVYMEQCSSLSEALKREHEIKKSRRELKLQLIAGT